MAGLQELIKAKKELKTLEESGSSCTFLSIKDKNKHYMEADTYGNEYGKIQRETCRAS